MKINNSSLFDIERCFLETDNRRKFYIEYESWLKTAELNYERAHLSCHFLRRFHIDGKEYQSYFKLQLNLINNLASQVVGQVEFDEENLKRIVGELNVVRLIPKLITN